VRYFSLQFYFPSSFRVKKSPFIVRVLYFFTLFSWNQIIFLIGRSFCLLQLMFLTDLTVLFNSYRKIRQLYINVHFELLPKTWLTSSRKLWISATLVWQGFNTRLIQAHALSLSWNVSYFFHVVCKSEHYCRLTQVLTIDSSNDLFILVFLKTFRNAHITGRW
jgi:hypothetical protein